jgi:cellulose synthase/poly-beta-1,6-N-acetylglucosamine synthase-like glycosyltransferase
MKWVFWLSFLFTLYTYGGYPAWLYLRTRWKPLRIRCAPILPSVSFVVAVHNEAQALPRKLRNLSELDYPADHCEIVVVSDGSTDATNEILTGWPNGRLRTVASPHHEGKASALNRGIGAAQGEIVVFTDARQDIRRDAIRHLVSNFADPSVGCVSGELMLKDPGHGVTGKGVGIYWSLEKKMREWEGASSSMVGATGALYAVRRELLVSLPPATLLDDVYLPLHVARQGKRVIFEPRARAFDNVVGTEKEFRRKVRTLTGNYQLLHLAPWLLSRENPIKFEFVSHKLFRLWVPFALLALLVSSLCLPGAFYQVMLVLQCIFYGMGGVALLRLRLGFFRRLTEVPLAFVVLNTAAVIALVYFLKDKKEIWVR